jgi:type I restriction enzyme S subunit
MLVSFLDNELKKVDQALSIALREIILLREYHSRLITDVVTGKLDVREMAKQLPEEAGAPETSIEGDEPSDETEFQPAMSEGIL